MAKKTTFNRDNPALNFISTATMKDESENVMPIAETPAVVSIPTDNTTPIEKGLDIPAGYKLVKVEEKRTKRLQLVIKPSLYDKVCDTINQYRRMSLNDYCHKLLEISVEDDHVQELIRQAYEAEKTK